MVSVGCSAFHEVNGNGSVLDFEAVVGGVIEGPHEFLNKVIVDVACHAFGEVEPVEVDFETP